MHRLVRENIELTRYKLDVSRHDRVATDANHENVSCYILGEGLAFRRRRFSFRDSSSLGLVLARFAGTFPLSLTSTTAA